ncbi:hypothetical protein F441_01036 [Phytophthora nicotianae CJ01A1]|uniref:Uncharacterized protein n=5 Tax=Phytophthora nicotianae TaxID=4792 RepID=W2RJ90_PHYN3|nr:hypothetical protein PPTG_20808 [Phytophthora nicotianae INRA-310]ETI56424.1 hypothetical protein F443_01063 [Phytophthora nicotianae P1569]ETO85159.1 hypothetical protein F444_01066 [Phytophthora nicotianae P1976]ETP26221.1 hypothetical protein F441_01036 [Phytophthora nicotianae CJ01A1]ETP54201.1 hypothetical protein F442_01010 [Phytophthora nicotianae P10297]ETN24680.1 hypothetical protein PPTG_20808 [Phytophthora nicotianae INRA-310]
MCVLTTVPSFARDTAASKGDVLVMLAASKSCTSVTGMFSARLTTLSRISAVCVSVNMFEVTQYTKMPDWNFMVSGTIRSAKQRIPNFILSFMSSAIASPPSSTDATIRADEITGSAIVGSAAERSGTQPIPSWAYSGKYFEMSCRPQKNPRKTGI